MFAIAVFTGFYMFHASEYARRAHPDRFANIIGEEMVYNNLLADHDSRVDTSVSIGYNGVQRTDIVTINGNITTRASMKESEVRAMISSCAEKLGYTADRGFDPHDFSLNYNVNVQSPEIALHANNGVAPDSRPCFGFACKETKLYLPKSVVVSKAVADKIDAQFDSDSTPLGPDGKVQVATDYRNGKPSIKKIIAHIQHGGIDNEDLQRYLQDLIAPLAEGAEIRVLGFIRGGTRVDKGQSGVKSLMYGESMPNGGGTIYGLDPTKPEVYGAALARQIAKSIVSESDAQSCEVAVTYFMGDEKPLITIGTAPHLLIPESLLDKFPITPKEVIQEYRLKDPSTIRAIIESGFVGNERMPWEKAVDL